MTMTKAEMAIRLCGKTNVSKDEAANLVEHTFEIIKAALERGEEVKIKIQAFGTFPIRTKRQRKGRNPKSGAEIVIAARKVVAFKSSPVNEENRSSVFLGSGSAGSYRGSELGVMEMEYRRTLQSNTWHFCRNCRDWPSEFNLVISTEPLADAQVCSECLALRERGECREYESAYRILENSGQRQN